MQISPNQMESMKDLSCTVCEGVCEPLDVVDFNKSCEEQRKLFLPLSGHAVYYYLCNQCGFCFAPELYQWSLEKFAKKIYNDGYEQIDPDYRKIRPEANANHINQMFLGKQTAIKHLDYGGGNGLLSDLLKESKWDSSSYDPFVNHDIDIKTLGKFDLITAFEVFEHVPDANELMSQLNLLIEKEGVILFSTLVSDGHIEKNKRLDWWYASPRNGHISLFSKNALAILAKKHRFNMGSFSAGFHVLFKQVPNWAAHIIKTQ
ncbi:HlpA protein [hydrothermal vent metagenome]|uniref:HlpA protein n=1 Tax=hydrothermal vent metagenome TaxID=652676 RepID=A0A1W1E022_9ZZZZ